MALIRKNSSFVHLTSVDQDIKKWISSSVNWSMYRMEKKKKKNSVQAGKKNPET